jgi:hypothetical protein
MTPALSLLDSEHLPWLFGPAVRQRRSTTADPASRVRAKSLTG